MLFSRRGTIDKFHFNPQKTDDTESNVSKNDNDTVNSGYDNSDNEQCKVLAKHLLQMLVQLAILQKHLHNKTVTSSPK